MFFEFEYLIIIIVFFLIFLIHDMWFRDENDKWMRILIILSAITFAIIILEHYYYVIDENVNNKHENYLQFKNNVGLNKNKSIRLVIRLMQHPILSI